MHDHGAMQREPPVVEHFHAPPEFLCLSKGDPTVTLPLGVRVNAATLRRFVRLMALEGQPVQPARLGYDPRYAFDAFARAHAGSQAALRAAALELFAAFEGCRA